MRSGHDDVRTRGLSWTSWWLRSGDRVLLEKVQRDDRGGWMILEVVRRWRGRQSGARSEWLSTRARLSESPGSSGLTAERAIGPYPRGRSPTWRLSNRPRQARSAESETQTVPGITALAVVSKDAWGSCAGPARPQSLAPNAAGGDARGTSDLLRQAKARRARHESPSIHHDDRSVAAAQPASSPSEGACSPQGRPGALRCPRARSAGQTHSRRGSSRELARARPSHRHEDPQI